VKVDSDWVPPWRTVEQDTCKGCGTLVLAVTLNQWSLCVMCAKDRSPDAAGQMRL
jgi:hypothetical protein